MRYDTLVQHYQINTSAYTEDKKQMCVASCTPDCMGLIKSVRLGGEPIFVINNKSR